MQREGFMGSEPRRWAWKQRPRSDSFDLADGRRLIPYRVITPDVSNALFRAEGKGPIQILSVNLSGKMPEIDHCDELQECPCPFG